MIRCAHPAGSPSAGVRPVRTALPSVEPRRGFSSPPFVRGICKKKSLNANSDSSSNNGGEGGIDSLRPPCGQSVRRRPACPDGVAVCRTPAGVLITPLCMGYMQKKSLNVNSDSSSNNGGEGGGFEPPIRCRIHTFQACSFSHSDTSPHCYAVSSADRR